MSRVLVVGATGLLGRPVADEMERRGFEVHRASRHPDRSSATSHQVDLLDVEATEALLESIAPEVVVQMTGGQPSSGPALTESHLVATLNLVRSAGRMHSPPTTFITGSAAEYGDPGGMPVDERSAPLPVTSYGWMKLVETTSASDLAALLGLELTVVRPFNLVSHRLPPTTALGNFRSQILAGEGGRRVVNVGRVDIVRDFVTTAYVGKVMAELVACRPGGIVNICSGVGNQVGDVMNAVAAILDVELELRPDPRLVAIPAPSEVVGDPTRLHSLVGVGEKSTPEILAVALLDRDRRV